MDCPPAEGEIDAEPDVAFAPLHAPEAAQEVAFVEDQETSVEVPTVTFG